MFPYTFTIATFYTRAPYLHKKPFEAPAVIQNRWISNNRLALSFYYEGNIQHRPTGKEYLGLDIASIIFWLKYSFKKYSERVSEQSQFTFEYVKHRSLVVQPPPPFPHPRHPWNLLTTMNMMYTWLTTD